MARTDDLPSAWPEFREVTANRPLGESARWSRFADRYRLAHGFLGIQHRDGSFAHTLDAEVMTRCWASRSPAPRSSRWNWLARPRLMARPW